MLTVKSLMIVFPVKDFSNYFFVCILFPDICQCATPTENVCFYVIYRFKYSESEIILSLDQVKSCVSFISHDFCTTALTSMKAREETFTHRPIHDYLWYDKVLIESLSLILRWHFFL